MAGYIRIRCSKQIYRCCASDCFQTGLCQRHVYWGSLFCIVNFQAGIYKRLFSRPYESRTCSKSLRQVFPAGHGCFRRAGGRFVHRYVEAGQPRRRTKRLRRRPVQNFPSANLNFAIGKFEISRWPVRHLPSANETKAIGKHGICRRQVRRLPSASVTKAVGKFRTV